MSEPVTVFEENVYYNSQFMEENKLYEIIWNDEKWALKKTNGQVEFLKWQAEKPKDKELEI